MKSPFARFPKLFKLIKWTAIAFLILLVLLFCFSQFENWRGRRAWAQTKAQLESKGYLTDWAKLIPQPIPDDQNLVLSRVMTACFYTERPKKEIGNWATEPVFDEQAGKVAHSIRDQYIRNLNKKKEAALGYIADRIEALGEADQSSSLESLAEMILPYADLLEAVREACESYPDSYLPGSYEIAYACPTPSFKLVRSITTLLYADSIIALEEGDGARIIQNCYTMQRVADLNPQAALLINVMIETVVMNTYWSEIIASGIRMDVFSESELQVIADTCEDIDLVKSVGRAFEWERLAGQNSIFQLIDNPIETMGLFGNGKVPLIPHENDYFYVDQYLIKFIWYLTPAEGWNLQMLARQATITARYQEVFDIDVGTVDLQKMRELDTEMDRLEQADHFFDRLTLMTTPAYQKVAETTVNAQRKIDLIQIASALLIEVKSGQSLPENLNGQPKDPESDLPYSYDKTENGFILSDATDTVHIECSVSN